jgi:hypothetical protein
MSFLRPKRRRWLVLLCGISCLLNLFLFVIIAHRPDRQPMLDNRQDVADRGGDGDGRARKIIRPARVQTAGLPPGY